MEKIKICIIKLGAKGDVVRTLPILLGIKQKYPDSEITWITKQSCLEIVETSPHIDKIFPTPYQQTETFDILYNFDIDEEATQLAEKIQANKKYGFYSEDGFAQAFNFPAEYYLNTLFDDELKKSNRKTYQQIMFETAELPYNKEHHQIILNEQDKKYAQDFVVQNNINTEKLIGIHYGASPRWPSKKWHKDNLKEFIKKASEKDYEIILFGGPDEIEEHEQLFNELTQKGIKIHRNNPQNSVKQFASLVNLCNSIICSESFALHIALALKKPTITLFFCTSPNEIEDYRVLKKIISPKLYEFFPEKSDQYDEELVKSISPDEVLEVLEEHKNKKAIFLDRDGVINKDFGYVHKIEDFEILPGVFEALKKLQAAGFKLIIITNQSGIGRDYYTLEDFFKVNQHMLNLFQEHGIKIEKVYFCKHSPEANCGCRKPKTKFIKQAIEEFNLNPKQCWMIGDKLKDVEMGEKAGCRTILIESKYVKDVERQKFKDLYGAAEFVLGDENK